MLLPANAAYHPVNPVLHASGAAEMREAALPLTPRLHLVSSAPVVRRLSSWPFTASFDAPGVPPPGAAPSVGHAFVS